MNSFDRTLLGESPELKALLRSAQIVAATDVPITILGESGSGKELLAKAIHDESSRSEAPFVVINCAALDSSSDISTIQSANGGTLFLDEVAELPLNLQAQLLQLLESGMNQTLDIRIISATQTDLYKHVETGAFRNELYYRLNVVPLEIPPLRERSGDTRQLLGAMTIHFANQYHLSPPTFTKDALELLDKYCWPGNVRELRNLCERMLILSGGKKIGVNNLPAEIRESQQSKPRSNIFDIPDEGIRLDEVEQQLIHNALNKTGGNRSKAARLLGLTRDTLLYRIKKYALN